MPRTRTVTWTYECDAPAPDGAATCEDWMDIRRGDHVETGRGVIVYDQADADAVARQSGWSLGRHMCCPRHAGGVS